MDKRCTKCGCIKPTSKFYVKRANKNGLDGQCRVCKKKANAKWAREHPDRIKEIRKRWKRKHPERWKAQRRKWLNEHREKAKKSTIKWNKAHPEQTKLYSKRTNAKRYSTLKGRLNIRMSNGIRHALNGRKHGRHWEDLVGYTLDDLKKHLKSKFTEGMTWKMFLRGKIHVDHIIPQSRFHYETPDDPEFKICWGLANLQPLWAHDNQIKYTKMTREWMAS